MTPEGKILAALLEGPKSYSELKSITGLSDRWLSKKLKEVSSAALVEHHEGRYQLRNPTEIIDADLAFAQFLRGRLSLKAKAKMMVDEISLDKHIIAVVLFGSVAKDKAYEESDNKNGDSHASHRIKKRN